MARKIKRWPYVLRNGSRLWWCPTCKRQHRVWMYWPAVVGKCPRNEYVIRLMEVQD